MRKLGIFILFILVFVSFNFVSASDISVDGNYSQVEGDIVDIDSNIPITQIGEDILQDSPNSQGSSTDDYTIYVGTNSTPNGLGTKEDPFATFDLACQNVNDGEKKSKVTINVFNGNYSIGSYLIFNTDNLNINATEGSVVLKNLYNDQKQSFGLTAPGNFMMSNVIVDASDYHPHDPHYDSGYWFTPFVGNSGNTIIFDNCTFTGFEAPKEILPIWEINDNNDFIFNYCKFISSTGQNFGWFGDFGSGGSVTFNYCVFSAEFENIGLEYATDVTFDSCWLGHNNGYTDAFFSMRSYNPNDLNRYNGFMYRMPFLKDSLFANRHAVLEVSENYLGDNTYEIIGKLMWNDGTDDNIDKLGSMIVYLSADNGDIPNTAILENGAFNVTYTSNFDYHEIAVKLDNQTIKLNNKINFTLNAPTINYGDNQNITVTFPSNVNGTVYVTVNNKTYRKYCDNQNNVTVPIDDILTKGNYLVDVSFAHDKNDFDVVLHDASRTFTVDEVDNFGFNTSTLSVLGIGSSLTTSPVTTTYNATKELVATLTDINGIVLDNKPVHIVVGTIDKTLNTTSDGKVSVDVSGLVPGSYVASISFVGDELYEEFSTTTNVVVNKVVPNVIISPEGDLIPGEKLIIKVEVPYATENVNIIVNGDKNTTKLVDNAATYTIDELAQGTYYVTVLYSGDDICEFTYKTDSFDVVKSTVDLIKDLNSTVMSQSNEIRSLNDTVNNQTSIISAQKEQISILNDTVNNQTSIISAQKEQISALSNSNGAKATVSKKATKLTAPKKTFKAKAKTKKVQIKLKSGKTVLKNKKITLKVKGKTYTAKTNKKGIAIFKITKLTKKGTFKYTVKFAGDKAYKTTSKKGKIIIK